MLSFFFFFFFFFFWGGGGGGGADCLQRLPPDSTGVDNITECNKELLTVALCSFVAKLFAFFLMVAIHHSLVFQPLEKLSEVKSDAARP